MNAVETAARLAADTGKASRAQIEDLLSGERARVRRVVEVLPAEDLLWALGTEVGAQALRNAIALMPEYYLPGRFDREVAVRFEIARPPGETVVDTVSFGPEACLVLGPDYRGAVALTVYLDGAGFTRIATGLDKGMELMMRGELRVQGDVQVAMKMEAFFGLDPKGKTR